MLTGTVITLLVLAEILLIFLAFKGFGWRDAYEHERSMNEFVHRENRDLQGTIETEHYRKESAVKRDRQELKKAIAKAFDEQPIESDEKYSPLKK